MKRIILLPRLEKAFTAYNGMAYTVMMADTSLLDIFCSKRSSPVTRALYCRYRMIPKKSYTHKHRDFRRERSRLKKTGSYRNCKQLYKNVLIISTRASMCLLQICLDFCSRISKFTHNPNRPRMYFLTSCTSPGKLALGRSKTNKISRLIATQSLLPAV